MKESLIKDCGKLKGKKRKYPLQGSRKGFMKPMEFRLGLKEGGKGETVVTVRGRHGYRAAWGMLECWQILSGPDTHSPCRRINVDDGLRPYLVGLYVPGKDLLSWLKDSEQANRTTI